MRFFLFFLALFVSYLNYGQYTYPKKAYAQKVLESTLVVELFEDDNETAQFMNKSLKEVFVENWKATPVLFMTQKGIDSLCKVHKNGYAILYQNDFEYNEQRKGHINRNGGFGFNAANAGAGEISTRYTAFTFSHFKCYLNIRIDGINTYVTSVDFGNGELTKIDHLFLCQRLSHLINAAAAGTSSKAYLNIGENQERLKQSSLLLPKDFFKEKDHPKIAKYYEHNYELVDWAVYQNAILNKEKDKSYVKIIWSNQHKLYMWIVVNAADGSILAITGFGGIQFGNYHTVNDIIKAKHLKYVTSKFAQKFNNRYGRKM